MTPNAGDSRALVRVDDLTGDVLLDELLVEEILAGEPPADDVAQLLLAWREDVQRVDGSCDGR